MNGIRKLPFESDYMCGAMPQLLQALAQTNEESVTGYGADRFCLEAIDRIREACQCPQAEVHFLSGGTQANATMIDAMLQSYQGVIAADSGHINTHEAGAIEFGGHKVISLPGKEGKLAAEVLEAFLEEWNGDENRWHEVMPGLCYLSQPTEYGTLYTRSELEALSGICHEHDVRLYVDGARLMYALGSPENDVGLPELCRYCDAFYIGGTKCGALLGEAVVVPNADVAHLFTVIKQHGALLAKGRVLGVQFRELFTNELYLKSGKRAVAQARAIRETLIQSGFPLLIDSPTNQLFPILENEQLKKLQQEAAVSFWAQTDREHTAVRIATSWATRDEDVEALRKLIASLK